MPSDSDDSIKFQVNFTELFNDDFMRANTKFQTMDEMLESASVEDPEYLKTETFSQFVASNTRFSSWPDMYAAASAAWTASRLQDGLQ